MKKILLFFFIILSIRCWSQGNILSINNTVPPQIAVCGAPQTFTISIYNPSPFNATNDTLKLELPTGITYTAGSVSGTGVSELNISVPNKPVFLLPPIASLAQALTITFNATANCDVVAFISGGGAIQNKATVSYTANNLHNFDSQTSITYSVKQPVLSIATVTNQVYSGSVGDTYTRCITITNSGLGDLSTFTFTDIHGAGITINNITTGNWVHSGTTETVTFNSSNFTSIGNNNGLFEQGESITLCETVHITSCVAVASNFSAGWGCNNQICQTGTMGGNVLFPSLIPNIELTPINPTMNPCMGAGNASIQKLLITNTGPGQATNIHLDIFQTNNGSGYNNNVGSYIDELSFTIQHGNASPVSIAVDSSKITNELNCMASGSKGRVFLTIPTLNSGDTIYLSWNTYSCCYNSCASSGQSYLNGWAYQGNYSNNCQNSYVIASAWGRVYSQLFSTLINGTSPSTLDSGQTGAFDFLFTSYGFQQPYPGDTSAHWKLEFTLPPCLVGNANPFIVGSGTWNPTTVTTSGNIITAIFSGTAPPFDLNQARIKINLDVDCNGCAGGTNFVSVKTTYVPSNSCSCEVIFSCANAPITILCSEPALIIPPTPPLSSCPEGMMFRFFSFKRTSYGLPDNELGGGNGLPDVGGSLNFSTIKTNRSMFGDTITCQMYGRVRTSLAHTSWQYCYATNIITNGNLLSFLDAQLVIYRNNLPIATCTNFIPVVTQSNTTRLFSYDLSVAGLISSGYIPLGFTYQDGDSLIFSPRYKVSVNTGGPIVTCEVTNEYYVSDSVHPSLPSSKFQCDNFLLDCFVMGYKFETHDDTYYTVSSCENITISQKYYLSIGPCCNNYEGGNLFPYEYRNWAHIDTLLATIPTGYTFLSAHFNESRTAGSGLWNTSSLINLIPSNPDSTTFVFPVEHFFDGYGGNLLLSDDGFSGTLEITLAPSCKVTPVISQGIRYDWTFEPTNYLTGQGSFPTFISATPDYVIYNAPSATLQSTLPSINVSDSLAVWEISLSNLSNTSNAENVWLSCPTVSGVTVVSIEDVDNNITVSPTGSIYQLGGLLHASERHFKIYARFNSCNQDSVILYSGWNCSQGYPIDVASFPCTPSKIKLTETPNIPGIDMTVIGPNSSIQLCDTTTYTIEGFNFQLGTLYNVLLSSILPVGVSIVPGSSTLLYPSDSSFASIPNPTLITGTTWQWNLSAINNLIQTNGVKGFNDSTLNSFKIKFKVVTNCNFISGSTIHFVLQGNAACGLPITQQSVSNSLMITGATPPYATHISMSTTYISPCAASSTMHVAVANAGAAIIGATDSVAIILPQGISYENASFAGQHNAPTNTLPQQQSLNNQTTLMWQLPSGTAVGDSVVFNFNFSGTPNDVSCGISYFQAHSIKKANVLCTSTGNPCNIGIITGSDTLPVFAYKGYLSLSNPNAVAIPAPPLGEMATIGFDIVNSGQDIFQINNTIISYYADTNGNGSYDSGDTLITNDTLNALIPSNGSYPYSSTIFLPAGSCSVIAVLDTAINHCSCTFSQLPINIPQLNISADTTLCANQSVAIGFPPINGYTYLWTPSSGLSDTTIASPTFNTPNATSSPIINTFKVTVNRINCVSIDTIIVTTSPNPIASTSGTDTICYGANNGQAIASITTNTTPPYTYSWNTTPPQLNDTATGLVAGTYTVTVTDTNSCSNTHTFVINQPTTALSVSISNTTGSTCNNLCNGDATAIGAGGISGYSYSWSTQPTQNTANATGLCASSYSVTITDNIGCTAMDSITISSPPAIQTAISLTNASCINGATATASITTSGGIPAYTYLWSNGQTDTLINGLSAGLYTLIITDSVNCTKTDTIIVTPALHINLNATSTNICDGQNDIINTNISSGTPGYSFLWNTTQTTQSISPSPSVDTTFTVIAIDTNGCVDSASITIIVHSNPIVDFFPNDTIGCSPLCIHFQDTSTISSGAIQFWLWDFGDGSTSNTQNPTHCFINDTIYTNITSNVSLTVTSTEGCSTTLIKNNCVTVYPSPVANFDYTPKPATILAPELSFQNLSLGAVSWEWHFSDGQQDSTSILQNPNYTYSDTGNYAVTLIASNSFFCTDTIVETIIIGDDWSIYIPNAFSPNEDFINDTFFPKTHGIEAFEMLIFDRWGNLIFQSISLNNHWDGKANNGKEMAQEDVYVYVIKATDIFHQVHKYRGTVTLVR
jgi:gliding motility-associated-like protein